MRALIIIAIALLGTACSFAKPGLPPHVAILQANQASEALKQCSRPSPSAVSGGWDVSPEIAAQIEADLPKLSGQMHGVNPQVFYRQYVGIVQAGKRRVYINAFAPDTLEKHDDSWETKPTGACDGGNLFWGAVYDPVTHQFSELEFNGAI
jgi:hypothetical protein